MCFKVFLAEMTRSRISRLLKRTMIVGGCEESVPVLFVGSGCAAPMSSGSEAVLYIRFNGSTVERRLSFFPMNLSNFYWVRDSIH